MLLLSPPLISCRLDVFVIDIVVAPQCNTLQMTSCKRDRLSISYAGNFTIYHRNHNTFFIKNYFVNWFTTSVDVIIPTILLFSHTASFRIFIMLIVFAASDTDFSWFIVTRGDDIIIFAGVPYESLFAAILMAKSLSVTIPTWVCYFPVRLPHRWIHFPSSLQFENTWFQDLQLLVLCS